MKYIVVSPIKCNSGRHEVGEEVSLSAEEAKPMLASGSIRKPYARSAFDRMFGGGNSVSVDVMEGGE